MPVLPPTELRQCAHAASANACPEVCALAFGDGPARPCPAHPKVGHPSEVLPHLAWTEDTNEETVSWCGELYGQTVRICANTDGPWEWSACWGMGSISAEGDTLATALRRLVLAIQSHFNDGLMALAAAGGDPTWTEQQQPSQPDGFLAAPAHYDDAREVVDQVRDQYDDRTFAAICAATAFIYEARAGRKGDPVGDDRKARWWRQMERHVDISAADTDDPRSGRPNFQPYLRMHGAVLCHLGDGVIKCGRYRGPVPGQPHRVLVRVQTPGRTKDEVLPRNCVAPDPRDRR